MGVFLKIFTDVNGGTKIDLVVSVYISMISNEKVFLLGKQAKS